MITEDPLPDDVEENRSQRASLSARSLRRKQLQSHLVIISLFLCLFLAALDVTIIAPALPVIASHLNATTSQYTWVGSAYTLASTSTTPLWARISDIWGRRAILMLSNAVFLCGSLVCALSRSPLMLIGGRAVQGVGSGGIIVMVTIIVADLFPLRERAKYYALTGIIWAISSGVGPILGGVFTQTIGWRWCFYINLPFDGLSLVVLFFFLRLEPVRAAAGTLRSFDWIGSVLVVGGTVCFLYGLESGSGNEHNWDSAFTLGLLIGGLAILAIFGYYEWSVAKCPILPLRSLVSRSTIPCFLTAFFHSFTFIAYDYFNPLYFQLVLHVSPIQSGLYLFSLVLPLSAMTLASGFFVQRTGAYRPAIWFGSSFMVAGTGLFIDFGPHLVLWKIVIYQLIAGVGAGPLFQAPMIAFQSALKPENVATGNAALTFLKNLATSLSLVIGGVVAQSGLGDVRLSSLNGDGETDEGGVNQTALLPGLRNMWIFYTAICGTMAIVSLAIKKYSLSQDNESERGVNNAD
ncbi:major facilitator superfamily-domain-containing protein [Aspergillus pseudonomiae]|uniref:Major facilitator superfamily-domain-containing protein n=1 Tax=Aspergillus pseudonomiae TaxID=1506151 RepID=A0A5N7CUC8_9EURO|nr:major facilitator superfamily-domain-containing protein [Aspergillus pseudonomiae]KAE8397790.1 major facilitator superfamily-domain-containing protein [Aspergillus pseudonomiae]